MDHEKQPAPAQSQRSEPHGELPQDEFFNRLKADMGHAKPGQDAISAALQAIQRLAVEVDTEQSVNTAPKSEETSATRSCVICGAHNPPRNHFCAACGAPLLDTPLPELEGPVPHSPPAAHRAGQNPELPAGEHHYHHHYHHHYFSALPGVSQPAGQELRAVADAMTAREVRPRAPLPGAASSRAEAALRRMTQHWTLACNTRKLDDLVELYAADALVLRPNVAPVRGTASIREFFFAALDAGLGEVEMEPLRVELFGDVAFEAGRCKMLVPGATGKRREERGKYLIIFTRQDGEWKFAADCWSSDLSLGVSAEPARPGVQSSAAPPRPPHKTA